MIPPLPPFLPLRVKLTLQRVGLQPLPVLLLALWVWAAVVKLKLLNLQLDMDLRQALNLLEMDLYPELNMLRGLKQAMKLTQML